MFFLFVNQTGPVLERWKNIQARLTTWVQSGEKDLALSTFFPGRTLLAPRADVFFFIALCGHRKSQFTGTLPYLIPKYAFADHFKSKYVCLRCTNSLTLITSPFVTHIVQRDKYAKLAMMVLWFPSKITLLMTRKQASSVWSSLGRHISMLPSPAPSIRHLLCVAACHKANSEARQTVPSARGYELKGKYFGYDREIYEVIIHSLKRCRGQPITTSYMWYVQPSRLINFSYKKKRLAYFQVSFLDQSVKVEAILAYIWVQFEHDSTRPR